MNSLKQQIKSGYALRNVRQAEALAGHTVSQHYSPGGFRLLATPSRKWAEGKRRIAKLRARYIEHVNVTKQHRTGGGIAELIDFERGAWGL